jgi:hypothetical protein
MAQKIDIERVQEELVSEFKWGNEARVRTLLSLLGTGPHQIRAVLEAMFEHPDALIRQAAAFGLGELGGAAGTRKLEQQLAIEGARDDYDGESVIEEITRALGRIQDDSARASLVRRLERMAAGKPERSDVSELAIALWKKRHPELIPAVRSVYERITLSARNPLDGLLILLEKSPEELAKWVLDSSVPVNSKTTVLVFLEAGLPDEFVPMLGAFIGFAPKLFETPVGRRSDPAYYCERLFSVLLGHRENVLAVLGEEQRSMLRTVARDLIVAIVPVPSLWAAVLLKDVGRMEDVAFLETYCPADPTFAKVFNDAAQALRSRQRN